LKTKHFIFWLFLLLFFSSGAQEIYPFQDSKLSVEQRVNDLIGRLPLDEKVSLMLYNSPAIDRLNIPAYNWWNEALHGVGRAGKATVFPQAIGLAATFDPDLVYRVATAISDEARAKHNEAVKKGNRQQYTGLTFWSPNINIFRDPRWGRGQETYGEDPFLTSQMGVAFFRGMQGDNPIISKHLPAPSILLSTAGQKKAGTGLMPYPMKQICRKLIYLLLKRWWKMV